MINEILQGIGVAIALILAIWWIVRRVRRKQSPCDCGCSSCPLSAKCTTQRKRER